MERVILYVLVDREGLFLKKDRCEATPSDFIAQSLSKAVLFTDPNDAKGLADELSNEHLWRQPADGVEVLAVERALTLLDREMQPETITVTELRTDTKAVLDRVQHRGQVIEVTRGKEVAAVITPAQRTPAQRAYELQGTGVVDLYGLQWDRGDSIVDIALDEDDWQEVADDFVRQGEWDDDGDGDVPCAYWTKIVRHVSGFLMAIDYARVGVGEPALVEIYRAEEYTETVKRYRRATPEDEGEMSGDRLKP